MEAVLWFVKCVYAFFYSRDKWVLLTICSMPREPFLTSVLATDKD